MARKPRTTKKSTASKTVAKKTEPVEKKVSRVEFKAKPVTGAKVKLQPIAGSQVKIPGVPFAFSGRIVEAYYTNPELDTIEIMWSDGEKNRSYYLKVDENDDQFKALLSEYSYENLDESTRARNESQRQVFRDAFHRYATEHGLYNHGGDAPTGEESQGSLEMLFDFRSDNAVHKEILFKLKLKMFEQESVKKSDDKELKSAIRKSSTILGAIKIYADFIE